MDREHKKLKQNLQESESESDPSNTGIGTVQARIASDLHTPTDSEHERWKPDSESKSDSSNAEHGKSVVSDLFPPTDVILEVEGTDIHLNKQVLMDNSDVFRAMFEKEFREKYQEKIPLPGKNYDDFVEFLRTFYPSSCAPITEQTILKIAPLADEYEVDTVQRKCESFLQEVCQKACDDKYNTIETSELVDYLACAERCQMTSVLPLAIRLCAERSARLLKEAELHTRISPETAKQIFESRDKMTEEEVKSSLSKGYHYVPNTMKLYWESFNNDERKKYEGILVDACRLASKKSKSMVSSISVNELIDIIIIAERNQLVDLQSAAVELASKCGFEYISACPNYNTMSSATKLRICKQRFHIVDKRSPVIVGYCPKGMGIDWGDTVESIFSSGTTVEDAYRCPK